MIAPAGYISDKIGRKAAVVPAATLAGLAFVGFYLSTGPLSLGVSAVVLGVAAGLAVGSMTAFTYDIVAPDARGMVQAFRRSTGELGSFFGPLVGGVIASATYPGVAFLALAPLHFLSALLVWLVARESLGCKLPAPAVVASDEPPPRGRANGSPLLGTRSASK